MARTAKNRVKGKSWSEVLGKDNSESNTEQKKRKKDTKETKSPKKTPKRVKQTLPSCDSMASESTVTTKSKTTSVASKKASKGSPIGRRRRRRDPIDCKNFTQSEKKSFYESLVQNGFNCVNNEDILLKTFPNRSITQIKTMIDGFTRRAQELNRKSELSLNSDNSSHKQPIDKWFDLVHQLVPNVSKKDDMSELLIELLDEFVSTESIDSESTSDEVTEEHSQLIPDITRIYECIRDSLNGKYASKLKPIDAFFVVKLIEELKGLLMNDNLDSETDLLGSEHWFPKSGLNSNEDYFNAIYQRRQQQLNGINDISNKNQTKKHKIIAKNKDKNDVSVVDESEASVGPSTSATTSHDEDSSTIVPIEDIQTFPKLRKIVECFNPMKVPIDLMKNEFIRWQTK